MDRAQPGRLRADVAHDNRVAFGYAGSERTTRRAVANAKRSYAAGHRRVTNMPRLDIRLGLLAAAANRGADAETIHARLLDLLDSQRLTYRQLDRARFDPTWVLDGFPVP